MRTPANILWSWAEMGRGAQVLQGCILVGSAMGGLSAAPECALIDEHKREDPPPADPGPVKSPSTTFGA